MASYRRFSPAPHAGPQRSWFRRCQLIGSKLIYHWRCEAIDQIGNAHLKKLGNNRPGIQLGCDLPYFAHSSEIRDFVQAVESLGYDTLSFSEHVAATRDSPFPAGFSFEDEWHEAFVQAAFVSAVTQRIELTTSMALLALRPTVLAAKQAAEIDLLSHGRLRLGVSIGWNEREVESLGQNPRNRGARFEEQIHVMRLLWSQPSVTFSGRFHELSQVGISPRPTRKIPVWVGAGRFTANGIPSDKSLRRIARCADGYKMFAPLGLQPTAAMDVIERLRHIVAEEGRDADSVAIEARLLTQATPRDEWRSSVEQWARRGADYVSLGNRVAGGSVDDQIRLLADVIGVVRG